MKKNLIGEKYNYLTVIGEGRYISKRQYWICQCECGTIKEIRSDQLKSGGTKSCGCYKNSVCKKNGENRRNNLVGEKYGKLLVLEDTGKKDNDRRIIYKCKCDCGNIIEVPGKYLLDKKTRSCGCLKASYGEYFLEEFFKNNNITFEKQKSFDSCRFPKTNRKAFFDFFINNNILIEYDGKQHFQECTGFFSRESLRDRQERDNFKDNWCNENGIELIRIPYYMTEKEFIELMKQRVQVR